MVDFIIKQWDKNKDSLRKYLEDAKYEDVNTYEKLVKLVITHIINKDNDMYGETIKLSNLKEIDYGDYQGTLIYVFPADTYQPSANDTFYTSVYYGSCSGCDTLLGIVGYCFGEAEKFGKEQVDDLMELCLHLVQNIHRFKDED